MRAVSPLYPYCTLFFQGNQCLLHYYDEVQQSEHRMSVGYSSVLYLVTLSAFGSEGQLEALFPPLPQSLQ